MAGMMAMKLEGADELERKLVKLPKTVAKKIVRQAVRKGGKTILQAAKGKARTVVGGKMGSLLAKFIVLRNQKRQKRGSFGMNVFTSEKGDAFFKTTTKAGVQHYIPSAIEYGHGRNKEQAARPFMRRAFDAHKRQAADLIMKEIRTGIEAEASKPG